MRYLLDTNICIYVVKRKPVGVLKRLELARSGDVAMSIITYLELAHGAWKSQQVEANLARIEELSRVIPVLPLDIGAAECYGRLRAELDRAGRPIGPFDLLIGAHALSLGLTVVTNNVREFARIRGLRVENWAA